MLPHSHPYHSTSTDPAPKSRALGYGCSCFLVNATANLFTKKGNGFSAAAIVFSGAANVFSAPAFVFNKSAFISSAAAFAFNSPAYIFSAAAFIFNEAANCFSAPAGDFNGAAFAAVVKSQFIWSKSIAMLTKLHSNLKSSIIF